MRQHRVGLILAIALVLVAPRAWADNRQEPADDYPSDVASVWFDTLYDVIKSEATAPPPASRIYGVSAIALYEAVVPGALHHRSLVGQLNELTAVPQPKKNNKHHWPTVANAALCRMILGLFPSLKPENLTAINALEQRFAAQNATWLPYIMTPPFPTYISGHSTQSGATAYVLTDMFGNKRFTDTTHTYHGLVPLQEPRTFDSFEAAVSRLYGGIHFPFDNHDGLSAGQCIGQAITDRVRFRNEDDE